MSMSKPNNEQHRGGGDNGREDTTSIARRDSSSSSLGPGGHEWAGNNQKQSTSDSASPSTDGAPPLNEAMRSDPVDKAMSGRLDTQGNSRVGARGRITSEMGLGKTGQDAGAGNHSGEQLRQIKEEAGFKLTFKGQQLVRSQSDTNARPPPPPPPSKATPPSHANTIPSANPFALPSNADPTPPSMNSLAQPTLPKPPSPPIASISSVAPTTPRSLSTPAPSASPCKIGRAEWDEMEKELNAATMNVVSLRTEYRKDKEEQIVTAAREKQELVREMEKMMQKMETKLRTEFKLEAEKKEDENRKLRNEVKLLRNDLGGLRMEIGTLRDGFRQQVDEVKLLSDTSLELSTEVKMARDENARTRLQLEEHEGDALLFTDNAVTEVKGVQIIKDGIMANSHALLDLTKQFQDIRSMKDTTNENLTSSSTSTPSLPSLPSPPPRPSFISKSDSTNVT